MKNEGLKLEVVIIAFVVGLIVAGIVVFAVMLVSRNKSASVVVPAISGPVAVVTAVTKEIKDETGKSVFSAIMTIDPLYSLWWVTKGVVFFFAFVFFCHGPLMWMGFLFSIRDGMGKSIYTKDRILKIKITYYGRYLDKKGDVVEEDEKNNFLKPFRWFKNYFFGSLHILGIPGIHRVEKETYTWERFDLATGAVKSVEGVKGEFPLREFIPVISLANIDVNGGQVNAEIGILLKGTNPMKMATVPRDWLPFLYDMLKGHFREFFAPLDFFRVMISTKNFGETEVDGTKEEELAGNLALELMVYFNPTDEEKKKYPEEEKKYVEINVEVEVNGKKTIEKKSLQWFIEYKYGIKIIGFYIITIDPSDSSKELLNLISKPKRAKIEAKVAVTVASGEADAFDKKREAMIKSGGELLRKLEALENSNLVTLGGERLNLFVNADPEKKAPEPVAEKDSIFSSTPTKKKQEKKKGDGTSGNP